MSKERRNNRSRLPSKVIITVAILSGLLLVFDLTPFGGTIKYYTTWARCGQVPVVIDGSGYFNVGVSHYYTPPKINIFPANKTYFCTAFDAEKHGYSANPDSYDFPVLEENNALCQKPTDPEPETAAMFSKCKE